MPNRLPPRNYARGAGGPLPPNTTHTPEQGADVDAWALVRPQGRSIPAPAVLSGQNIQVGRPPTGLVPMLQLQAATVPNQLDVRELLPVVEVQQDGWIGATYSFATLAAGAAGGTPISQQILAPMANPPYTQTIVALGFNLFNTDPVNPYPAQIMQLLLVGPNGQPGVPIATFTIPAVLVGPTTSGPSVGWDAIGGSAGAVVPVPPGFSLTIQSVSAWPSILLQIVGAMWSAQISGQQRAR